MSEWIFVKDKLPSDDGLVLIYAPSLNKHVPLITTAWYDPLYGWSLIPKEWIDSIEAWMPLPEPPSNK